MKMGSAIVENGKKVLTMTEYIEREAVLKEAESRIMWGASAAAIYELIRDAPAADVATVRHGRWIASHDEFCSCSICKYPVYVGWNQTNYCPNCGAKMDGGDGNSDMA